MTFPALRFLDAIRLVRRALRSGGFALLAALPLPPALAPAASAQETPAALILQAGNAEEEKERLRLLLQLSEQTGLPAPLRTELGALLPIVAGWADRKGSATGDPNRAAENGYLCRFITKQVKPAAEGAVHPPEPAAGSPLHPIWAFYRARMLIWRVIEVGPLRRVKEQRDAYFHEARQLLDEARKAFPENRVIRMYLGEPMPWSAAFNPDPGAPEWANLQREGIGKLADIIHWWIDERQLEDGQFGGGWGDDVEMWRWWTPVLVGFQDPKIEASQERLSNGIFKQPHLAKGFTSHMTDVEHSNEDTTDTILPMMHLRPDDPAWRARALRLAELMRGPWTGRNDRGFLQFRSIYFNVDAVDPSPRRAFDTVYHASVIQPALLAWQRTADPDLAALFGEWLGVWIDAAARADNGKPAGILPSTIRWPEGAVGAPDKPWWEPFFPSHNDALYNWPGAARLMTSTLLLAWHMTNDDRFLAPISSMASFRNDHRRDSSDAPPGSDAWCGSQIRKFLPDTLAKYRFITGDKRHDQLLQADASGYTKYRLNGDMPALVKDLRRNAQAFRSNREGFTTEVRWTDRVLAFPSHYLECLPVPPPPNPLPEALYASATGDPGTPLVFPLNAVRWLTPPRDIAALVTTSGQTAFAAQLYHFAQEPRDMAAELYLLRPGNYTITLAPADGASRPLLQRPLRVTGPRTRVDFLLPARKLCILDIH